MASKAAASRASKTKVVARGSKPLPKKVGAYGQGSPLGVQSRLGGQSTPGNSNVPTGTPNYETPGALGAVTPIAAPPVVRDPFLTPTDLANQALEMADVEGYLKNVDLNIGNARIDAQQRLSAVDTAENRNLEAADWNTAARGLGASSIRDQQKANLSADAAQSRSGTKQSLKLGEDYAAGEHQRADTVIKPAINSKYNEAAKRNAQDVTDNSGVDTGPAPGAAGGAGPVKGAGPTLSEQNAAKPTVAPGPATQAPQEQWNPVVKNGKFYHYYPSTGKYVYIRPAS